MFIGINLALEPFSVAVFSPDAGSAELAVSGSRNLSEHLMEELGQLAARVGKKISETTALAIASGPGSYTGLRVALTAAKTLGQSLKIPVFGVPSLEAIARHYASVDGIYLVATPARKKELNSALFGCFRGTANRLSSDFVWSEEKMERQLAKIKGPVSVVRGPLSAAQLARRAFEKFERREDGNYRKLRVTYSHPAV
jgi:tRNA threonylcarbamoyl adenosine modification protein YeaZ